MKAILISILLCINLFSQGHHGTEEQKVAENQFILSGYTTANFVQVKGEASAFGVGFSPLFLWGVSDDVLVEAELEFGFEGTATTVMLEYAQILWVMNHCVTFGAGKFLSPNNVFSERYHPSWINKLPDMPLGLSAHSGAQLLAGTQVGVQARSGLIIGDMRMSYSFYVSNGGMLNAVEEEEHGDEHGEEEEEDDEHGEEIEEDGHGGHGEGLIAFGLASDNNSNKAIGGRIGFLPIPQLEIGYGFETARIGTDGTHDADVRSLNHVVDINYKQYISIGTFDIRGQWTYLEVSNQHEPNTALYGQCAFTVLRTPVELVFRYDEIVMEDMDINRVTYGINYWINHSTVLKMALGSTATSTTYSFQLGIGL